MISSMFEKSELCKSCAHTKVCMKDKREVKGFPCEDYLSAADMVDKERYARLLANAIIVCDALKEYQAADMVEVVRCKDCKHNSLRMVSGNAFCDLGIGLSQIYDFCSLGERRDDEDRRSC